MLLCWTSFRDTFTPAQNGGFSCSFARDTRSRVTSKQEAWTTDATYGGDHLQLRSNHIIENGPLLIERQTVINLNAPADWTLEPTGTAGHADQFANENGIPMWANQSLRTAAGASPSGALVGAVIGYAKSGLLFGGLMGAGAASLGAGVWQGATILGARGASISLIDLGKLSRDIFGQGEVSDSILRAMAVSRAKCTNDFGIAAYGQFVSFCRPIVADAVPDDLYLAYLLTKPRDAYDAWKTPIDRLTFRSYYLNVIANDADWVAEIMRENHAQN